MWSALLALLRFIPILGGIIDKFIPTRHERENSAINRQKQRERESIDNWVDRGGGSPPA
jgi:DNA polymerase III alpha subunit